MFTNKKNFSALGKPGSDRKTDAFAPKREMARWPFAAVVGENWVGNRRGRRVRKCGKTIVVAVEQDCMAGENINRCGKSREEVVEGSEVLL